MKQIMLIANECLYFGNTFDLGALEQTRERIIDQIDAEDKSEMISRIGTEEKKVLINAFFETAKLVSPYAKGVNHNEKWN